MEPNIEQQIEAEDLIPGTVSLSYRMRDGSSGDRPRVLTLNLKTDIVEHCRLDNADNRRYLKIKKIPLGFKLTFSDKQDPMNNLVPKPIAYNRVVVQFNRNIFKIDHAEDVPAQNFDVLISQDGNTMFLYMDMVEFLANKPSVAAPKIVTKKDKVDNGFKADTAWGETFNSELSDAIRRTQENFFITTAALILDERKDGTNGN